MSDDRNGTPVQGIPVEVTPVPELYRQLAAANDVDIQALLVERIAEKAAANAAPPSTPPSKKFLGIESGGWARLLLGLLVSVCGAVLAFYVAVRVGLQERPVREWVEGKIESEIHWHEDRGRHAEISQGVEENDSAIRAISEVLVEHNQIHKQQNAVFVDIKSELQGLKAEVRRSRRSARD